MLRLFPLLAATQAAAGTVNWSWSACDSTTSVSGVSTNPAKPVLGSGFTAQATLTLQKEVTGGTIEVTGHVLGRDVQTTADLCKTTADEELPMNLGHISTTGLGA